VTRLSVRIRTEHTPRLKPRGRPGRLRDEAIRHRGGEGRFGQLDGGTAGWNWAYLGAKKTHGGRNR
jgi:hypothetical protein